MTAKTNARSSRLSLRVTKEQKITLRCAAEVARKSLNDFIVEAAYSYGILIGTYIYQLCNFGISSLASKGNGSG
jgi:hypothetical protein